jgi:FAD/FMN-containing dehydrogenase
MTLSTAPASVAVEALKAGLRGELIQPGAPAYDAARSVWNGMIDKRPALIVRCAGVADVIDSVNFARDNGVQLAVRGGSHSAAGLALCDGASVRFGHDRRDRV